jgi:hypothetical protein
MPEIIDKSGKLKFSQEDFKDIAEFIIDEHRTRKSKRKYREKVWKEIDRQLRMEPEVKYKKDSNGNRIKSKTWMPEMELPNQSQALEVLSADALRMMFPDSGDWFCAKALADRKFLEKFRDGSDLIVNDDVDTPSVITQENVDDYVQGWVEHGLRQFDHRRTWDLINTEVFKYGDGVGRARIAKKPSFLPVAQGTADNTRNIPILAPVSIKNVYLDESSYSLMADGLVLGPATIFHQIKNVNDIKLAAQKGSKDPKDENGGWMPDLVNDLEGDKNDNIEYLEYEGDLVVSKSSGSIYIPNVIATVVIGKNGDSADQRLIRFRFKKFSYSSYIHVPYQTEHVADPYSTSPLMKGEPIQRAGSECLNRFMQAAILNTEPIVQYSRDDQLFSANGGPLVVPGAQWETEGLITVHKIGDPAAIQNGYLALLSQYSDVTGINAPRLGAQTVSHTTAYAKDQEIERGQSRTVDYVRATLHGPMTQWMNMFYEMSVSSVEGTEQVYMDKYGSFMNVSKEFLPEKVHFEVYGSSGPQDTIQKMQQKMQALMGAIQVNQISVQMGGTPLNLDAIQKELLKQGGIQDVDAFMANGNAANAAMGGANQLPPNPSAETVALQGLQGFPQ